MYTTMYITALLYHFYIYDIYLSRNLYSYFYLNTVRINLVFIRNIYFCYFSLERYSRKNSNSPSDNHLYLRLHRGMHLVAVARRVRLPKCTCSKSIANRRIGFLFVLHRVARSFGAIAKTNPFFFSSRYNARIDGFE